jgi:hypothetical protein
MRTSGVWGHESIDDVLRRRGQLMLETGNLGDILLPLDHEDPPLLGQLVNRYRELFGKDSFRKVARALTAARGAPVPRTALEGIAGRATAGYIEFLEALDVAQSSDADVRLTRRIRDIGPSLEWYVKDLCECELRGSAEWSVKLEGLPTGGDFDVLAWLAPALAYIELKSSAPSGIDDSQL